VDASIEIDAIGVDRERSAAKSEESTAGEADDDTQILGQLEGIHVATITNQVIERVGTPADVGGDDLRDEHSLIGLRQPDDAMRVTGGEGRPANANTQCLKGREPLRTQARQIIGGWWTTRRLSPTKHPKGSHRTPPVQIRRAMREARTGSCSLDSATIRREL
jgi:hypothetical protein